MKTIQTKQEVSDEILASTIIVAVEGATGYWAQVSDYRGDQWETNPAQVRATLHEIDESTGESEKVGKVLDIDAVAVGIQRILNGEVPIATYIENYILEALRDNDAGHIDAEAADCIAQAALLGELRYG